MTHFAAAGEHPGCVRGQLTRFALCTAKVRAHWPSALVHAANSAACLVHPEARLDMVRCGIAVYGIAPPPGVPGSWGLTPVLSWTSALADLRTIQKGGTAGYGHAFRATRATRIGLVPVGYADGFRRSLGNRGMVLVAGRRQRIVGRIAMDTFMVELDNDLQAELGDQVTLLGSEGDACVSVEEMAALLGTISYEVTCGLSLRRAGRVFLDPAS